MLQACPKGCFTRTLKTCDKHNSRVALKFDVGSCATHQRRQLIADNLGHHLTGLNRVKHILTHRLLLYIICKVLGYLVVDIGIDKCTTNLLKGLCNIDFGDATLTL